MKQGLVFAAASATVCLVLSGCAGSGEEPLAAGASSEPGSGSPNGASSESGSSSSNATSSESAKTSPSDAPSQTASVPPPGGPTLQTSPAPAPSPTATSEALNWRDSPSRYLYTYEDAYYMVTERGMPYYSAFCLNYSPVTPEGVAQCDGIVSGIMSFISGDYIGPFRGPEYTDLKATTYPR